MEFPKLPYRKKLKNFLRRTLPVFVFIILSFVTLFIWLRLVDKEKRIMAEHTKGLSEQAAYRLQDAINIRFEILKVMSERWVAVEDWSYERYSQYASLLYSSFPGFQAINWINPQGIIEWVYPIDSNLSALNKDLHNHDESNVREVFGRVEQNRAFGCTDIIELYQTGQGFAVYYPLILKDGTLQGYLNGVFRIKPLVEACLPQGISDKSVFGIFDQDELIYINISEGQDTNFLNRIEYLQQKELYGATLAFCDKQWTVIVFPSQTGQLNNIINHNLVFLVFGLLLACAMVVLVQLLIKRGVQHSNARALAISEKEYTENIIATIPSTLLVIDRELKIISANPSFYKIYAVDGSEAIGEDVCRFITRKLANDTKEISPHDCPVCQRIKMLFDQKQPTLNEEVKISPDEEEEQWLRLSIVNVTRSEEGQALLIMDDVSDQKRAERDLRMSEERYRNFLKLSAEGIFRFELKEPIPINLSIEEQLEWGFKHAFIAECNDAMAQMYGYTRFEEVLGATLDIIFVPGEQRNIQFLIDFINNDYRLVDGETIERDHEGNLRIFLNNITGVIENGRLTHVWGTQRDITAKKRAERTQNVLYNIANAVNTTKDLDDLLKSIRILLNEIVDTTNFFIALYDKKTDDITIPYMVDEKDHFDSFPAKKTLTAYVIRSEKPLLVTEEEAYKMINAGIVESIGSASKVWLGVPLRLDGEVKGALVVQNYTDEKCYSKDDLRILEFVSEQLASAIERKRSHDALRENEERYRSIVENSHDAILILDENLNFEYFNEQLLAITDCAPEEVMIENFNDYFNEEDKKLLLDRFVKRQRGEDVPSKYEVTLTRRSGEKRRIEMSVAVIPDSAGRKKTIVQMLDITDRKNAEEKLKTSEELNRGIVINAPIGIVYLDKMGEISYLNQSMANLLGMGSDSKDTMLDQNFYKILHLSDDDMKEISHKISAGESFKGKEVKFITLKGDERIMEIHAAPKFGASGELAGSILMCLDLTNYKEMELHLRQAQKMEAIGTLAGGIAHDFNNLLTGIMGNVELALMTMDESHPLRENLQRMQKSAMRATELTAQLLAFGRRRMEQPKVVNLNGAIDEAVELLHRTIDPRIEILCQKDPNLWVVKADEGQINQVLLNMLVNATDAMPDGGKLYVKSGNTVIEEAYCKVNTEANPGEHIKLTIEDTGFGIRPENLEKIFDPFFTTKEPGKGTGLGLAMVYGIIKGHNGWIEVESEVGRGTVFKIFLPRVREVLGSEKTKKHEDVLIGGSETILVVDDEDMVRNLGETILKQFGYKVFTAVDGFNAIEMFEKQRDKIELVILDMTMPRKSGRDTLRELLERKKDLKIIISSGYSKGGPVEELLEMGAKGFVQKPYRLSQLLKIVREILDN